MSTTMIGNHHRRFVTPVGVGPPNKRKAWDHLDGSKPSPFKKPIRPSNLRPGPITQAHNNQPSQPESAQNNQLLAGYLAHEFLTKGTLFGEPWDPARAEAVPVSADSRREEAAAEPSRAKPFEEKYERYVEVADLLKTDKVQLSGVVNPTQLARFLHQ